MAEALRPRPTPVLALLALGVVFGDIGTSPLYALRECFGGHFGVAPTPANVLGVLSLIVWALVVVIAVKYLLIVLRADNRGEGGIIALMALVHPEHGARGRTARRRAGLVLLGLFGAALLYGDGMITPAISVLSAVEGLNVATHTFEPFVVPITVVILIALFVVQRHGTARVGAMFGPVTLVWFATLGLLGLRGIALAPEVLQSVNPLHGAAFLAANRLAGFLVLGAVFLVVTGGEALYADMGHFGARPIRLAWFTIVLPGLLLNYFGQGALLLHDPSAASNPFYLLAPRWALYPLVALATAATIIASQAIISGTFSLTMQAIHLGYSPRLKIEHTSATERGQIYVPPINWILMIFTIALVLGFRSSSALAGAYGLAVSLDMVLTTILVAVVARELWGWRPWAVAAVIGPLLLVDLAFFAANVPKVPSGGWFPLVIALAAFTLMTTWRQGRRVLGERLRRVVVPLDRFFAGIRDQPPIRVPGTAVFLTGNSEATPAALQHNLQHNKVLHERVVLLTVVTEEEAYVSETERLEVADLGMGFHRIVARYGFMEDPDVPALLRRVHAAGLPVDLADVTYFLGRERLISQRGPGGMMVWRERLFSAMARNSQQATAFFRLPPERVVELGAQIRL